MTSLNKRLEVSLQESEMIVANLNKKLEHKESSFLDQTRRINEKLIASEAEKQKLLFEQNSMLLKIEESERKNQSILREKERAYHE